MSKYYEWDNFKNVYLEDSFVLSIDESQGQLSFFLEVVLNEEHALYKPPIKNEQYCYKKAKIIFKKIKSINWLSKSIRAFNDANNSEDYGNIDILESISNGYYLSGDWGEVIIYSSAPVLEWCCPVRTAEKHQKISQNLKS